PLRLVERVAFAKRRPVPGFVAGVEELDAAQGLGGRRRPIGIHLRIPLPAYGYLEAWRSDKAVPAARSGVLGLVVKRIAVSDADGPVAQSVGRDHRVPRLA